MEKLAKFHIFQCRFTLPWGLLCLLGRCMRRLDLYNTKLRASYVNKSIGVTLSWSQNSSPCKKFSQKFRWDISPIRFHASWTVLISFGPLRKWICERRGTANRTFASAHVRLRGFFSSEYIIKCRVYRLPLECSSECTMWKLATYHKRACLSKQLQNVTAGKITRPLQGSLRCSTLH